MWKMKAALAAIYRLLASDITLGVPRVRWAYSSDKIASLGPAVLHSIGRIRTEVRGAYLASDAGRSSDARRILATLGVTLAPGVTIRSDFIRRLGVRPRHPFMHQFRKFTFQL